MENSSENTPKPDVLILGAGIAGMQAALEVADSGHRVYLVERTPTVGGRMMQVDQFIEGPLCDVHLSGTVYVGCQLTLVAWEEYPTFLEECDFTVEEGTVVYVAAHNDAAYYKGCSCHVTGEEPGVHE